MHNSLNQASPLPTEAKHERQQFSIYPVQANKAKPNKNREAVKLKNKTREVIIFYTESDEPRP